MEPASAEDADGTFSDWNKREEYRKHQYRFAECGLWALERRADGVLVGKAGLTDGELGYHIYERSVPSGLCAGSLPGDCEIRV